MEKIGIVLLFGINAWQDLRKKEVNLLLILLLGSYGIIQMLRSGRSFLPHVLPLGISGMFLGLSILSGGMIGMGDALFLLAAGMALSAEEFLWMLVSAFFLASLWALVQMVLFRKGKNTEIPLLPFLFLGYAGGLAAGL